MSFYLKPPRGIVNFHTLEICVEERLMCYESLYKDDTITVSNVQCLIEDTALDRSGHFIFRLAAFTYSTFINIFIDSEVRLFEKRLSFYERDDILHFLKSLLRQAKQCCLTDGIGDELRNFYSTLQEICKQALRKDFSHHVYGLYHLETEYCELYNVKVPFTFVPSLVSTRTVELRHGYAIITCKLWKKMLSSLLVTHLRLVLKEMKYNKQVKTTLQDERVKECLKRIRKNYFRNTDDERPTFDLSKLDVESRRFPLCMQNLLSVLQQNHRLSHDARFEFSLFMKDIGLSMNSAMRFWEEEYSKEHSACAKCTHSWQENQRKYLYGIRHLYGLEGSRKHYAMKSCNYLQEKILSATDEGGCPFKHFDDDKLHELIKQSLPSDTEEIEVIIRDRRQKPNLSCKLFHSLSLKMCVHNAEKKNETVFGNPVDYYLSFKEHVS